MNQNAAEPAGHLFIAGTGRAGTSFLVRYLTELGLDTHISRNRDAKLGANANAGFEDLPLVMAAGQLPYVVKSPWIGEYIDQILASPEIKIALSSHDDATDQVAMVAAP